MENLERFSIVPEPSIDDASCRGQRDDQENQGDGEEQGDRGVPTEATNGSEDFNRCHRAARSGGSVSTIDVSEHREIVLPIVLEPSQIGASSSLSPAKEDHRSSVAQRFQRCEKLLAGLKSPAPLWY